MQREISIKPFEDKYGTLALVAAKKTIPGEDYAVDECLKHLKSHLLPCSKCSLSFARLIYIPGAQTSESLKERACLGSNPNEKALPTWVMGEQHIAEVIWPIRRLFRAVTLREFMNSLGEWEEQHCTKTLTLLHRLQ